MNPALKAIFLKWVGAKGSSKKNTLEVPLFYTADRNHWGKRIGTITVVLENYTPRHAKKNLYNGNRYQNKKLQKNPEYL